MAKAEREAIRYLASVLNDIKEGMDYLAVSSDDCLGIVNDIFKLEGNNDDREE